MATAIGMYTRKGDLSTCEAYNGVLPPGKYLPYKEFSPLFQKSKASTEKYHPNTLNLSQTMAEDTVKGMEQLLSVDETVVTGFNAFIPALPALSKSFTDAFEGGGRVIFVGSGSSGRIAVDLAAKFGKFSNVDIPPHLQDKVIGVIAGGDSAMVRAREGFEDSAEDGEKALKNINVGPKDVVVLISASGSASFNVGAGHYAANQGSKVRYFANSEELPDRTTELFKRPNNPAIPVIVDTGAQSIGGSTRLQAAALGLACLGAALEHAQLKFLCMESTGQLSLQQIQSALIKGDVAIWDNWPSFKSLIEQQNAILTSPLSNTRRVRDDTNMGYVTLIGGEDVAREICIDTTEVPPTFSLPFYRREGEAHQKRPPFQAYVINKKSNNDAWTGLVGRPVNSSDIKDVNCFILDTVTDGENSYAKRPKGKGNMVIGVCKLNEIQKTPDPVLIETMRKAKQEGGDVRMIIVSSEKMASGLRKELDAEFPNMIVLEEIPRDLMGVGHTLVLKQALNLISNSSMILGGNVQGNKMINVRASNNKLIDRTMREVNELWKDAYPDNPIVRQDLLYSIVVHNAVKIKEAEAKGEYTPSIVKITLAMLDLGETPAAFDKVVRFLMDRNEKLDFLPKGH